jgi:hypothetical protein
MPVHIPLSGSFLIDSWKLLSSLLNVLMQMQGCRIGHYQNFNKIIIQARRYATAQSAFVRICGVSFFRSQSSVVSYT